MNPTCMQNLVASIADSKMTEKESAWEEQPAAAD